MSFPLVEIANVSKSFSSNAKKDGEKVQVLDNFSLTIRQGDLLTFFGPNGAGKSTLLNLIAGIEMADSGQIHRHQPTGQWNVGYVFQNYTDTLLPWRKVWENVAFPLELRKMGKSAAKKQATDWLQQFNLSEQAGKYVYQLSGGQKQLVALARATVYEPDILLLDEPFSALDYSVSRSLWQIFRSFWVKRKVTTVFISHDIDEALFLGNKVYVLSGRPAEIVAEIDLPFSDERNPNLLRSSKFFEYRSKVIQAFEGNNNNTAQPF